MPTKRKLEEWLESTRKAIKEAECPELKENLEDTLMWVNKKLENVK